MFTFYRHLLKLAETHFPPMDDVCVFFDTLRVRTEEDYYESEFCLYYPWQGYPGRGLMNVEATSRMIDSRAIRITISDHRGARFFELCCNDPPWAAFSGPRVVFSEEKLARTRIGRLVRDWRQEKNKKRAKAIIYRFAIKYVIPWLYDPGRSDWYKKQWKRERE